MSTKTNLSHEISGVTSSNMRSLIRRAIDAWHKVFRSTLIPISVMLIALTACSEEENWLSYSSEEKEVTFQIPEDWEVNEDENRIQLLGTASPQDSDEEAADWAWFSISSHNIAGQDDQADPLVHAFNIFRGEQIVKSMSEIQQVSYSSEELTINGRPAARVAFEYGDKAGDVPVIFPGDVGPADADSHLAYSTEGIAIVGDDTVISIMAIEFGPEGELQSTIQRIIDSVVIENRHSSARTST